MNGDNLSRVERVDLREAWRYEDRNFTPWLAENLDELGAALGVSLELQGQEVQVGSRKLDILATERYDGRPVVIENQLEPTDNDHLSRLLIYAAGMDAQKVVWVAQEIVDEHRQVLDWLNQRTGEETQFYGVAVELWKIDNSRPAPHFKVVVAPNGWQKSTIAVKQTSGTEGGQKNKSFRKPFADTLEQNYGIKVITGEETAGNWCVIERPVLGTRLGTGWRAKTLDLDVTIVQKENPQVFQNFATRRADIESMILDPAVGDTLTWDITEAEIKIIVSRPGSIYKNPEAWDEYRDWIIDKFLKLREELVAAAGDGG